MEIISKAGFAATKKKKGNGTQLVGSRTRYVNRVFQEREGENRKVVQHG